MIACDISKLRTHQCPYTPSFRTLHHNPDIRSVHHTSIVLDDIVLLGAHSVPTSGGVHELLQQCDLLLDIVDIVILCIEIDDLECNYVGSGNMSTSIDCSIRSLAKDL